MLDFNLLRTPPNHGDALVAPGGDDLARLAEANARLFSTDTARILGVPLSQVRAATREELLGTHAAAPLILTGHQPEFIHAGVWAKHVAAKALASRLGGVAANLVVDSDVPRTGSLTIPAANRQGTEITLHQLGTGVPTDGTPYEQVPARRPDEWATLASGAQDIMGERFTSSQMGRFCAAASGAPRAADWVDQMGAGRAAIDEQFGVRLPDWRISRVFGGPLLQDVLLDARRFAAAYNDALRRYRRTLGIKGTTRPIPDLDSTAEEVELPLWLLNGEHQRRRLFLRRAGDAITLLADEIPVAQIGSNALAAGDGLDMLSHACGGWVIRPRALALTLWARLALADVFIHGIGGAKYDRITDDLIRGYYGIEPPGFICTSATLRLDLPRMHAGDQPIPALRHRLHQLRHGPERLMNGAGLPAELLTAKRRAVEQSERLRRTAPRDHAARAEAFRAIRQLNDQMLRHADALQATRSTLSTAVVAARHNRIADDREYFYGLFAAEPLDRLCAEIRQQIGIRV